MPPSTPRPSAKKATAAASTKAATKTHAKASAAAVASTPTKTPTKKPAKTVAKTAVKAPATTPAKARRAAPAKATAKVASKQQEASTASPKRAKKTDSTLWSRPGFLIRRLHQIHCALFAEEVPDAAITPVQYSLLSTLDEFGELDQNTLSHRIGLERTSVAEVLPRLEERQLIGRKRSAEDGRIRLVALTADGKALLDSLAAAVARAHARTIEALPAAQRKELMRMMALLVTSDSSERAPLLKRR